MVATVGSADDDALPGAAALAPVGVTVAAGFFALDEGVAALLEHLFATAAVRTDHILQTRRGVLGLGGLRRIRMVVNAAAKYPIPLGFMGVAPLFDGEWSFENY